MSAITETVRQNLAASEPELWNHLVHAGLTEKVLGLIENAYETGVDVAAVGATGDEDIEATLDRTCEAYALAYATFCAHMLRTTENLPPNYNTLEAQLCVAQKQAVPAFLRTFLAKLSEFGIKPIDRFAIQTAQEVPPVKAGGLILP